MKRVGYLYDKIFDRNNIILAIKNASNGKTKRRAFKYAISHVEEVVDFVKENPFYNGIYKEEDVVDKASGKSRHIKVPDFKNLIIQHAIMQVVYPILAKSYYFHSYGAIRTKGMFKASKYTRRMVRNNKYCSKDDVVKFYDSVRRMDVIRFVRRKIKDESVIELIKCRLDEVGVAIGNFISQILANFLLTPLDHYVKEDLRVKDYIRNMDDYTIFGNSKRKLKATREAIKKYIHEQLALKLHDERNKIVDLTKTVIKKGKEVYLNFLDFCGYKHYKDHTTLRKRTYRRIIRLICVLKKYVSLRKARSFVSYWGFITKTNCHKWLRDNMPLIDFKSIKDLIRDWVRRMSLKRNKLALQS